MGVDKYWLDYDHMAPFESLRTRMTEDDVYVKATDHAAALQAEHERADAMEAKAVEYKQGTEYLAGVIGSWQDAAFRAMAGLVATPDKPSERPIFPTALHDLRAYAIEQRERAEEYKQRYEGAWRALQEWNAEEHTLDDFEAGIKEAIERRLPPNEPVLLTLQSLRERAEKAEAELESLKNPKQIYVYDKDAVPEDIKALLKAENGEFVEVTHMPQAAAPVEDHTEELEWLLKRAISLGHHGEDWGVRFRDWKQLVYQSRWAKGLAPPAAPG